MSLHLTNTLTKKKEPFKPIREGEVKIYCCGVTVYDLCHLGHARSYIVWDILRRFLIWQGYKVTFVQNFTDIDDKILERAEKEKCSMDDVSERNIKAFYDDMDALGILKPDRMPRATKCLDSIRNLIIELEAKGVAYSVDGDVYFSVMKHSGYGKLSRRDLSEQQKNADGRVADAEAARKKHPFDFALWKRAKKGEPSFSSPWSQGRPGWHIECSAMVQAELGESIDIHLGGADLIFPHHENEIAQSEAATGKKLARYWLHNGMVNVGGQKMSKSLGNFTTIRALLQQGISPMTLRLFILQANYRKPLDFTRESLQSASIGWKRLNKALNLGILYSQELGWQINEYVQNYNAQDFEQIVGKSYHEIYQRFTAMMNDDLNTSGALAALFEIARPLKTLANQMEVSKDVYTNKEDLEELYLRWKALSILSGVLGLTPENINNTSQEIRIEDGEEIQYAIEARKNAKTKGDFATADKIRRDLESKGIKLVDKPGGITEWIR